MIITLLIASCVYVCVRSTDQFPFLVPVSTEAEHTSHMISHLKAHPAEVPTKVTSKTHSHEIFLGFDAIDKPIRIGIDSYSEGSLISSAIVGPHVTIHPCPVSMTGVGGVSFSPGYVELPCRLQWGASTDNIKAYYYVVDPGVIPQNVDLLLGLDSQSEFDITIDSPAHSIFVRSQSLEIRTDNPELITLRTVPLA
jgi:hypothetical protein